MRTKIIPGFNDKYLIREDGAVITVRTEHIKRSQISKRGYYVVLLSNKPNKPILKNIHRLLAEAFIENPNNKSYINHIDCNPLNNSLDNLEWCTNGENIQHAYNNGLMPKRAVRQIDSLGNIVKVWGTLSHTRRFFGMNASNIVQVCQGKRQTAYGYKWEYV